MSIDLIVRGQCTLVPGLRGISSHIRVRSIVGRFLEHSRIFYFENGGKSEVYLGSADWMPRNLYERVEVLFPLRDPRLKERICKEILPAYLSDNRKSRMLGSDGIYTRAPRGARGRGFSVQDHLMHLAHPAVNGSGASHEPLVNVAYTKDQEVTAPSDAAETPELEEIQDSLNATV